MQRRLLQAYTALREHSCVSMAKMATIGGFCNLDMIVIKATAPDDLPLSEKYIHELMKIFSICPSSFRAFSLSFTRRFSKTRCWRVALKCLILFHRLLRSLPETSPFRSDLIWARSNGLISLYPCHFRNSSSSASHDFTLFIQSYARLLDEALDCFSFESINTEDDELPESFSNKMKEVSGVLELLPQLQSLMDRVIDCKPTGSAARSFLIRLAMKQIVRDSFVCYAAFRKDIIIILDNHLQVQHRSCISAFGIYKKAAIQASQLNEFYGWCKSIGLCGPYEYPLIDKIPHIQVKALETFLNGMWQLTESSSMVTSPTSSAAAESPSILTEDEGDGQLVPFEAAIGTKWEGFVENEEREPLIQLDLDNNIGSWEALLEASVSSSCVSADNSLFFPTAFGYGYGNNMKHEHRDNETESWEMQVYNPNAFNPFHQSSSMPNYHGVSAGCQTTYWWGL